MRTAKRAFRVGALLALTVAGLVSVGCARAQDIGGVRIRVDAANVQNHITPWMTGSCIEDVNHEIYGGLYDQKIFGESFEEPPPAPKIEGWTPLGGEWRIEGDICRTGASAGGKLVLDDSQSTDAVIDADVRLDDDQGDNAGLLVRVGNAGVGADNFDGYEVSISARNQRLILGKHRHSFHPLTDVATSVTAREWHHLRVDLRGARIAVYLDDMTSPKIDFTDPDAPLLAGRLALRSWNSDVSFRNVRQTAADGKVLTAAFQTPPTPLAVSGMWDIVRGGTAEGRFVWDGDSAYNGQHSQRITRGAGAGLVGVANRGLNRWGIAVLKGRPLEGRVYLRGDAPGGSVVVALQSADGAKTYASARLDHVAAGWKKFPFRLEPTAADPKARFVVGLDRPGTVWVDQAVLMDDAGDRFHGLPIRRDIAQAIVDGGITFLRYGGTMVNVPEYRWKNMIGDPDRRPHYRGNWYPYATNGFGIFDFLDFCEAAHIDAAFAINIEESDAEAAELADYLTAPVSNPYGRLRAENGHPEPYKLKYIEIGNEEVLGGDQASGYQHYSERFRALSAAIHGRNPSIPLVCAAWWRAERPEMMKEVFQAVDGHAAAWDLHVDSDRADAGREVDRRLTEMQTAFQSWNPQTTLKAVIFEENGGLHNLQRAIGHATTINASRRHGDFVQVDCPANCLQPLGQNDNGWDQGQIFFTPDRVWGMPPYFAQQIASANYGLARIESDVLGTKDLDVLATLSQDGHTVVLSVANTGQSAIDARIGFANLGGLDGTAQVWTVDSGPESDQPPAGDGLTGPKPQTIRFGGGATYRFPPMSYTILRLNGTAMPVK